jgi:translocation and assembly module TamA
MVQSFQCRSFFASLACLIGVALVKPVHAQPAPPANAPPNDVPRADIPQAARDTLDPESPLAPMEDIGVAWPDMTAVPVDAATDATGADADAAITDIADERRYEVIVAGLAAVDSPRLLSRFQSLSVLKAGEKRPANVAQVARRAREDAVLLEGIVRAEGYYDAVIGTNVDAGQAGRLIVTLTVESGPLYRFSDVAVTGLDSAGDSAKALRDAFPIDARDPVSADAVIAGQAALKDLIGRDGFPFAKVGEPEIVIDHETRTATMTLPVETGGAQRMGAIKVLGDKPPFTAKHVARIARFKPGQVYNAARIDDLKRAIVATGLVSSVRIDPVASDTAGVVDMAVAMEPAPMRTIAGEVGYGTGEGLRAEVSWTHRNLIRPEGAVTLRGVIGTREQYAGGVLRQSNFRERDQVLNARLGISNINRNAFKARTIELAGGIERQTNIIWQKKWSWSAGFELLASEERDVVVGPASRKTFFIGALPGTLNYDGSDDLLDPKRGFRLGLRLSPEVSRQSGTFTYVRTQIDGSVYVPTGPAVVVAARARLGSIIGAPRDRIAPSRRLYSGGGGSVRGFGFQAIGPRDLNNDPVGGRSLVEFALEARVRLKAFGGAFAVVPFIDAGNIYASARPALTGLRYGAGIGLRYHSSFGPIRIDVATPINPQPGDTPVTVFVSLGQAF